MPEKFSNFNTLNRRTFVLQTAQLLAAGILSGAYSCPLSAGQVEAWDLSLAPRLADPEEPSFEVFYELSRWVTNRSVLDRDIAGRLYALFRDEPWGKKHMAQAYRQLLEKAQDGSDIPKLIRDGALGEGENWFVSHVLVTWFLGVYYHEARQPQRVTYEGALMWSVTGDFSAVPGLAGADDEYWRALPQSVAAGKQ